MKYNKTEKATFIERPNRFVAKVILDGEEIYCHVKNTGRCRELLVPGATVWLEDSENPARKYRYSLVTVKKGERLVNMDSQAPNKAVGAWLSDEGYFKNIKLLKPESKYGSSRFDFYCEYEDKKAFIEVKGVTLEYSGPFLGLIEIAHFYEIAFFFGLLMAFWHTNIIIALLLALGGLVFMVVLDNSFARLSPTWMLKFMWTFPLSMALANLIWLWVK